jgi:hypothetical protein
MNKSIKVRLFKANDKADTFFFSVNLIPVFLNSNESWSWRDCSNTILLIRFKILYNLVTDSDFNNFFSACDDYAAEVMFKKVNTTKKQTD